MRRAPALLAVLALAIAGCGGDDDAEPGGEAEQTADQADDDAIDIDAGELGFDPDFDVSDLPDNFPDELIPPEWGAGQWAEIGGVEAAGFLSAASFDDLAAHYTDLLGEGIVAEGEERFGTWTVIRDDGPVWVVGIFDESPTLVTVTQAPG